MHRKTKAEWNQFVRWVVTCIPIRILLAWKTYGVHWKAKTGCVVPPGLAQFFKHPTAIEMSINDAYIVTGMLSMRRMLELVSSPAAIAMTLLFFGFYGEYKPLFWFVLLCTYIEWISFTVRANAHLKHVFTKDVEFSNCLLLSSNGGGGKECRYWM